MAKWWIYNVWCFYFGCSQKDIFTYSFGFTLYKIITNIKSLQKTKFETDVVLNEALYDKVCFVGFQIKKMYLEYRFYDVRKLGTELCKKDVGKLEAIRYIYV